MEIYKIALWMLWASFLIVLPTITWAFKTRNTNWGRFWSVWFLTAVITGIILTGLLLLPDQIIGFVEKMQNILK